MREYLKLYIDGQWVSPSETKTADIINPATEEVSGRIALGNAADVDKAVKAASRAFDSWSQTSRKQRIELLESIQAEYTKRKADIGAAITEEMGAPTGLAQGFHVDLGAGHLATAIETLKEFKFEEQRGVTLISKDPIGVCALITPWNWPMNQVTVKVFPALATGNTMVLKPPQLASYSAQIFAEVMHAAGVPKGVFNMIHGSGSVVGSALSAHPQVDLVSITGSETVGIEIAKSAANTVKRVCQELGGKSAFIVLDDAKLPENVAGATSGLMVNSGQTCSAGSRLLVPKARMAEAIEAARAAAAAVTVGDPNTAVAMGPVVSKGQFNEIQKYIQIGIDEGAQLIAGGIGRPEGLSKGWFVKPTVFANVRNDMRVAREEIFGPVLVIIGYDNIDDAIAIANDSDFGLAGYVNGADAKQCNAVAKRMRTGWVSINGGFDFNAPFGGIKKSGNGREWGEFGFHEYVEIKSLLGYAPAPAQ
ncbi:aldehyde dehydrogenase family protein [Stenotrophobium rhamnosiphilum]|uniref:Aldehyde dehydrogenase family protein n=1 Tax=Stenotrophobium rhamnosiphilum TaxID=2029166 RepID=A0A2T5MD24_9GAMM|nr:aldehyde dehydrogenase family protein [Stenotrophobium rhamnosiphilum]PTU30479.1 aldehyde dehydrogenase family protein [Stenotrophobium rhamnosiphilum]